MKRVEVDLYRIIYCSRTNLGGSPAAVSATVAQIVAASRRNNARDGVTGGLLYSAGSFAQVLEGPLPAITQAFERIQSDERHSDVTVVQFGPAPSRAFGEWSMLSHVDARDGSAAAALEAGLAGQTEAGAQILHFLQTVMLNDTEDHRDPASAY